MFIFLPFVRFQNQVTVDNHPYWEARSDCQSRLDIEISLNNLLSSLIQALAGAAAKRLDDATVVASIRARFQFTSNA